MPRSVSIPAIAGLEFLTGFTPKILESLSNEHEPRDVAMGSRSASMVKYFKPVPVIFHEDLSNHLLVPRDGILSFRSGFIPFIF